MRTLTTISVFALRVNEVLLKHWKVEQCLVSSLEVDKLNAIRAVSDVAIKFCRHSLVPSLSNKNKNKRRKGHHQHHVLTFIYL